MIQGKPLRSPVDLKLQRRQKSRPATFFSVSGASCCTRICQCAQPASVQTPSAVFGLIQEVSKQNGEQVLAAVRLCLSKPHPNWSDFFAGIFGTSWLTLLWMLAYLPCVLSTLPAVFPENLSPLSKATTADKGPGQRGKIDRQDCSNSWTGTK